MRPLIPPGATVEDLTMALFDAKAFHQTKEVILKESCTISEKQLVKAREQVERLHQDIARLENAHMDSSGLHSELVRENDSLRKEVEGMRDLLCAAEQEI